MSILLAIWNIGSDIAVTFYTVALAIFFVLSIICKYTKIDTIREWKIFRAARHIATFRILDDEGYEYGVETKEE